MKILPGSIEPARNIWELFNERVPEADRALLQRIAGIASEMGLTLFLVGGAVRDVLRGSENIDLDLLVEGEGILLAEAVGRQLNGCVVTYPKFHTGKVELPDARSVDFATARTEFYQFPAALPTAEHSSVQEDLNRRDFTINAMALQLNGDAPGRLLDLFDGTRDLAEGVIRILHDLSFIEDPTRILRAVRFEMRFGFHMDAHSEELARQAIAKEMLHRLSGERFREELLALFAHPHPEIGLRRLDALGVLNALEPAWHLRGPAQEFSRLEDALDWARGEPLIYNQLIDPAYQRLLLALASLPGDSVARLTQRLRLRKKEAELARRATELFPLLATLDNSLRPSELDALLRPLEAPLCLLLLALSTRDNVWKQVREYLMRWHTLPTLLTGGDLHQLGIPRGEVMGRILHAVRIAQLDEQIRTRDDALGLAQRLAGEEKVKGEG